MKKLTKRLIIPMCLFLFFSSCATIDTVSSFTPDSPKVYSGTRLDNTAISQDQIRLQVYKEKYGVEPPEHPKVDFIFSFVLDTAILFVTIPIALYEVIFQS